MPLETRDFAPLRLRGSLAIFVFVTLDFRRKKKTKQQKKTSGTQGRATEGLLAFLFLPQNQLNHFAFALSFPMMKIILRKSKDANMRSYTRIHLYNKILTKMTKSRHQT